MISPGITSMSSSAKSMPASSAAISSTSACLTALNAAGERAFHLLRGDAGLVQRLRVDQIAHGFSLREIDAAGEKRALGEFAGIRPAERHAAMHCCTMLQG